MLLVMSRFQYPSQTHSKELIMFKNILEKDKINQNCPFSRLIMSYPLMSSQQHNLYSWIRFYLGNRIYKTNKKQLEQFDTWSISYHLLHIYNFLSWFISFAKALKSCLWSWAGFSTHRTPIIKNLSCLSKISKIINLTIVEFSNFKDLPIEFVYITLWCTDTNMCNFSKKYWHETALKFFIYIL